MRKLLTRTICFCLIGIFTLYGSLLGQERVQSRRTLLNENIATTDDPRRIPIPQAQQGPEGTLVLTGGRIFDGTGAVVRDGIIVIERNRIKEILPPGSTNWPRDAQVIDVAGKTILPGLIDLHTHITEIIPAIDYDPLHTLIAVERLRYYIESGVTSIRDLSSHGNIPFRLKELVSQNRIPGPRVFSAGQVITGTGGHSTEGRQTFSPLTDSERVADGPDEWRRAVREQFNKGADLIKITNIYSRDEVAAAIKEAHALGLKVAVDAGVHSWSSSWLTGIYYLEWTVEEGVDVVEKLAPRTDETISLMVEKGIESVPIVLNPSTIDQITGSKVSVMELFRKQRSAGIKMGIGLEGGAELLPNRYINELKRFVEGGYTIPEALVAATKTSAEILDMDDKLGTIESGKLADVIVIDGKPDIDLDDLANTDLVVRDGYIVVKDGQIFVPSHVPPGQEQ